ncbi:MAG: type II secretion system F family protein [Dethiobacteria bacterium]|jgi:tight adherence protein B
MFYVVCGGAFLTVILLFIGLHQLIFSSQMFVKKRLKTYTMPEAILAQPDKATSSGFVDELMRFLGLLGKTISRRSNQHIIQKKLLQAHILMRAEEYAGLTVLSGLGMFLLIYIITGSLLFSILFGLAGLKLPAFIVDLKRKSRTAAFTRQLPEALSIVSSGLRSGFSFPQAMAVVQREMPPPIGEEFSRVILENRMGKQLEEVLHNLGERIDSEDLNLVITALLIQKQVGGNLAEILDNIAHTIRERVRIQGEIKTLTAQGKLSAIIIVLLPFAVSAFLLIMNPDYMLTLLQETLGLIMLGFAVVTQCIGVMIIRKIVTIDI